MPKPLEYYPKSLEESEGIYRRINDDFTEAMKAYSEMGKTRKHFDPDYLLALSECDQRLADLLWSDPVQEQYRKARESRNVENTLFNHIHQLMEKIEDLKTESKEIRKERFPSPKIEYLIE